MRWRIAQGKANAAIQLGMGSRALMVRAEQQAYFIQSMNGLAGGEFVPVPGGVLIRDGDGNLLGAVGISGDTSDNDEAAALAGISAAVWLLKLVELWNDGQPVPTIHWGMRSSRSLFGRFLKG